MFDRKYHEEDWELIDQQIDDDQEPDYAYNDWPEFDDRDEPNSYSDDYEHFIIHRNRHRRI